VETDLKQTEISTVYETSYDFLIPNKVIRGYFGGRRPMRKPRGRWKHAV
jgi:hypothetical protein